MSPSWPIAATRAVSDSLSFRSKRTEEQKASEQRGRTGVAFQKKDSSPKRGCVPDPTENLRGTGNCNSGLSRVTRLFSALLLLVSACFSGGPEADLPYVKQARSVAAEWALINRLDAEHRLNPVYVSSMHMWLADQLDSVAASISDTDSSFANELSALRAEPAGAAEAKLRAHVDRLKDIEQRLESA